MRPHLLFALLLFSVTACAVMEPRETMPQKFLGWWPSLADNIGMDIRADGTTEDRAEDDNTHVGGGRYKVIHIDDKYVYIIRSYKFDDSPIENFHYARLNIEPFLGSEGEALSIEESRCPLSRNDFDNVPISVHRQRLKQGGCDLSESADYDDAFINSLGHSTYARDKH